jgi:HlyD family type I secretion membrane fusion protein
MRVPDEDIGMVGNLRRLHALRVTAVGLFIVFVFFGAFGAWAALAPLDSAAIAPGEVNVLSQRKTLQHLEGGIVTEILVDEGTRVAAGDVVVRLDATQSRIRLGLLQRQLYAYEARAARLEAERDGADAITYPSWLTALSHDNRKVEKVMAGQQRIFTARREQLTNRAEILDRRIRQLEEEIGGLEAEIKTQDRELVLIQQELRSVKDMVDKGVEPLTRLLALKRNAARIEGERAQNRAAIARAQQAIGETSLQIDDLGAENLTEIVAELREVENEIADVRERIAAAEDILRRTEVIAPVSGVVVNLQVHTAGGVVGPGDALLDLVPGDDALIIEARLAPTDIDVVHVGLPARVRLTAFNQRSTPSFEGTVSHVSADSIDDRQTRETFYRIRVELNADQPELAALELHPGMPVEVMVRTGERTLLNYLVGPIVDSFGRALKED